MKSSGRFAIYSAKLRKNEGKTKKNKGKTLSLQLISDLSRQTGVEFKKQLRYEKVFNRNHHDARPRVEYPGRIAEASPHAPYGAGGLY
jgi:hypothetical protein